jgi:transaldolase
LAGGVLQRLITERHVGVTNNPTIFASALAKGDRCTDQLRELRSDGRVPTTRSSRLPPLTSALPPRCSGRCSTTPAAWTNGVSIEVDPRLARDTAATVETAHALADAVDRPNVHVRIPGTAEALPAITVVIAAGISVNVTLIFSLQRYRKVIDAYLTGLERAAAALPLARIHSVASFFVFRVDTEVDARLDVLDSSAADALKGRAGVANARLAHQIHKHILTTERWQRLAAAGAHPPRPLWASTGVKDPAYPDTMYVTQLITSGTSTPCQAPPSKRSPTTASSPATPSPPPTPTPKRTCTASPSSASTSATSPSYSKPKASPSSKPAGTTSPPPPTANFNRAAAS